jgi:hypothetical protein
MRFFAKKYAKALKSCKNFDQKFKKLGFHILK